MKKLLSFLAGAVLLTACSAETSSFKGKEYKMLNAPHDAEITIGFDAKEPRFFGSASVNRYMGSYQTDGDAISFSNAGSTMMMGPEELMSVESDYLQFLGTVKTYKLNGRVLSLSNGSKTVEYEETATHP